MRRRGESGAADQRSGQAGVSLLELLAVLAILAVLAGLLGRAAGRDTEDARRTRAAADVQALADALTTFEATVGRWPTLDAAGRVDRVRVLLSGAAIPAANPWTAGHAFWSWTRSGYADLLQHHLVQNAPSGGSGQRYATNLALGWRGPYLDACPLDPWGRPYVANVIAAHSTSPASHRQLLVLSAGPDGRFQTVAAAAAGQQVGGDDVGCLVWQR